MCGRSDGQTGEWHARLQPQPQQQQLQQLQLTCRAYTRSLLRKMCVCNGKQLFESSAPPVNTHFDLAFFSRNRTPAGPNSSKISSCNPTSIQSLCQTRQQRQRRAQQCNQHSPAMYHLCILANIKQQQRSSPAGPISSGINSCKPTSIQSLCERDSSAKAMRLFARATPQGTCSRGEEVPTGSHPLLPPAG